MPRRNLDSLVTQVASELMGVDATTMVAASERVLASLVDYFDVEFAYLRHTVRELRQTVLIAEWPRRPYVPEPDPLRVIEFAEADSLFLASENAVEPILVSRGDEYPDYQEMIRQSTGMPSMVTACVPWSPVGCPLARSASSGARPCVDHP